MPVQNNLLCCIKNARQRFTVICVDEDLPLTHIEVLYAQPLHKDLEERQHTAADLVLSS